LILPTWHCSANTLIAPSEICSSGARSSPADPLSPILSGHLVDQKRGKTPGLIRGAWLSPKSSRHLSFTPARAGPQAIRMTSRTLNLDPLITRPFASRIAAYQIVRLSSTQVIPNLLSAQANCCCHDRFRHCPPAVTADDE